MPFKERYHNQNYSNNNIKKKLEYSFQQKSISKQQSCMMNHQYNSSLKEDLQKQCLIKRLRRQKEDLEDDLQKITNEMERKDQQLKQYKRQYKKLKLIFSQNVEVYKQLERSKQSLQRNLHKLQENPSMKNQLLNLKDDLNQMNLQLQQKRTKCKELQKKLEYMNKQNSQLKMLNEQLQKYKKQALIAKRQTQQIEELMKNNQKNYKQELEKNNEYIDHLNQQVMLKEQKLVQLQLLLLQKTEQIQQIAQQNKKLGEQNKTKDSSIDKLLNEYDSNIKYGYQAFEIQFQSNLTIIDIFKRAKNMLKNARQTLISERNQYNKKINEYQIVHRQKLQMMEEEIRFLKMQLDNNANFEKNIGKQLDKIGSKTNIFHDVRGKKSHIFKDQTLNINSSARQYQNVNTYSSLININELKRHSSQNKLGYNQASKQPRVSIQQLLYKKCKQIIF